MKDFLEINKNIMISKLSNLMIYLEKLYFELAIENKGGEYKEKLDNTTKEKIDKYYEGKSGQLITKDKLSLIIIRFILNDLINQRNDRTKNRLFEMDDDLFDILSVSELILGVFILCFLSELIQFFIILYFISFLAFFTYDLGEYCIWFILYI